MIEHLGKRQYSSAFLKNDYDAYNQDTNKICFNSFDWTGQSAVHYSGSPGRPGTPHSSCL